MHLLQQAPPTRLFSELYQKDLLVIGCRFPSWLVRSFIRLARKERLRQSTGRTVFVVDSGAREDQALVDFLRTFKTRTEVFAAEPRAFVRHLFEAWNERQPNSAALPPDLPVSGSIFVSYAGEDRPFAEAIVDALAAANLDVWYDRQQLMAGDVFMDHIHAGIRRADLFIPVLSRNSLTPGDRYFRREWTAAIQKLAGLPSNVDFIFPVRVDDVPYGHEALNNVFNQRSWFDLTGGVTPAFVQAVKERYKRNQGD
jgi:hypothetical protein